MSASSETSSPNKRRKLVEDIVDIDATPETGLAPNTVPDSSEGSGASADLVHPEPDIPSGPVKKNLWAQQCDVCQQNSGKYRCPGCDCVTCSMACSKKHKKNIDCSGKRARSQFLNVSQMTDNDLLQDVLLLTDAQKTTQVANKVANQIPQGKVKGVSKKHRVLQQEARRFNIHVQFLPAFMKRHQENTTYFDLKRLLIVWKVDFVFEACEGAHYIIPTVDDVKSIAELLSEHYRGVASNAAPARRKKRRRAPSKNNQDHGEDSGDENAGSVPQQPETLVSLKHIVDGTYGENPDQWCYFMKHTRCPANSPLYYKLLGSESLRRALTYREVIEFPVIHVLPGEPEDPSKYPLYSAEAYALIQKEATEKSSEFERKREERERLEEEEEERKRNSSVDPSEAHLDVIAKEMGIQIANDIDQGVDDVGAGQSLEFPLPSDAPDTDEEQAPGEDDTSSNSGADSDVDNSDAESSQEQSKEEGEEAD